VHRRKVHGRREPSGSAPDSHAGGQVSLLNRNRWVRAVSAAGSGTIVLVRAAIAEHAPFGAPSPAVMDAAAATGNVVVVDMGQGRYATYAHLKPGSVRVATGDRVVSGQPLARIGNSGNTLGPHLHFHISDAVEPLSGEGLPEMRLENVVIRHITAAGGPAASDSEPPAQWLTALRGGQHRPHVSSASRARFHSAIASNQRVRRAVVRERRFSDACQEWSDARR
jgi:murein DD-endopeptidase MepM/ murein hydrolase activator NlpD